MCDLLMKVKYRVTNYNPNIINNMVGPWFVVMCAGGWYSWESRFCCWYVTMISQHHCCGTIIIINNNRDDTSDNIQHVSLTQNQFCVSSYYCRLSSSSSVTVIHYFVTSNDSSPDGPSQWPSNNCSAQETCHNNWFAKYSTTTPPRRRYLIPNGLV